MAKVSLKIGTTSYISQIFIQDTTKTDGSGLTGLVNNSAGLTAYYHRDTDTTATAISLVTMTVGTFTSSGFKEIDATNMPGWYQFCPPNAALASGAKSCAFHLKGATNMAALPLEIELTQTDNQDAVRMGVTALPNAAAGATGGLPLVDANGRVQARVDVIKNAGLANLAFYLTKASDGTALTGQTDTNFTTGSPAFKKVTVDAGAAATLSGTITEVDSINMPGWYRITLSAGETNGKVIALLFQTPTSNPAPVTLVTSD